MILTFEKEKNGNWYIVLPNWKGLKSQLQMVAGSDDFLDIIGKERTIVSLDISLSPLFGYNKAEMIRKVLYGADYYIEEFEGKLIYHKFWLCPVTTFIFGDYPKEIYFKVLDNQKVENIDEL